jgi:hypothetical protein
MRITSLNLQVRSRLTLRKYKVQYAEGKPPEYKYILQSLLAPVQNKFNPLVDLRYLSTAQL